MFLEIIIILSLIQGITEFLPISSSGHLILIPFFLDVQYQGKTFDVILHLGTLLAVIIYLRKDISFIFKDLISKNRAEKCGYKIFKNLFFATVPVVFIGFFVSIYEIKFINLVQFVGWTTLTFGILLGLSDKTKIKKMSFPNFQDSMIIGIIQSIALIPGVSRSGIVITMGRFLGYSRHYSSKFALFLSIPVIIAASTLKLTQINFQNEIIYSSDLLIGFFLSFVFAFVSIKIFMKYIENASLKIFVVYRIILGFIIIYFSY